MPTEIEIKLLLPDGRTGAKIIGDERVCSHLMEPPRDTEMRSVYYDTPAGELSSRGWTLRVRLENGNPVAAFKTMGSQEGGLLSRGEWQTAAGTAREAVPRLVALGAPVELADFSDFIPRCEVEFTRRSAHLRFADGSVAEIAVDSGFLVAGEKREPLFELELELIAGLPDSMIGLAVFLETRYGLAREVASKYVRALRLIRSR